MTSPGGNQSATNQQRIDALRAQAPDETVDPFDLEQRGDEQGYERYVLGILPPPESFDEMDEQLRQSRGAEDLDRYDDVFEPDEHTTHLDSGLGH